MPPEHSGGSRTTGEGGTASRFEQRLQTLDAFELQLWIVVVVALVLDVCLTYGGLQLGLSEGNPVLGPAMETFGFAVLGIAKAGALAVAGLYRLWRPAHGAVIPLGLALPWVGAVTINAVHIAPLVVG